MSNYDRIGEIKAFDETKAGVKGLIDAGVTKIPEFFISPSNLHHDDKFHPEPKSQPTIPLVDFGDLEHTPARREEIVGEILRASETFGFFQLVNHGIPIEVLEEMMKGVRRFHEQPTEVKKQYYTPDRDRKVGFGCNLKFLYTARVVEWRDSMFCVMAPNPPDPDELPLACRDITFHYSSHIQRLGNTLFELLSEALGLNPDHLNDMECATELIVVSHYSPSCPEPKLALCSRKHSDPSSLTILLQDKVGGLQVLHQNQWIDVTPLSGALVINIGDILQLISNDKLKSVEHRVLATEVGPRISITSFFRPTVSSSSRSYDPIKELLSKDSLPIYRDIKPKDYFANYFSKGVDGQSTLNNFKL